VCGFIVPDLPLDESEELWSVLAPHNIALVQMVTPVTPAERLAKLATASQGFVYAVTMTGTTGKAIGAAEDLSSYLERVRAAATVPVCAGSASAPASRSTNYAVRSMASSLDRHWWKCSSAASRRRSSWRA